MEKKKTTALKATESAKLGYGFTKRMYADVRKAQETGAPIAWVKQGFIANPILAALGIVAAFPENYGAASAAKRGGMPFIEAAEADGFSPCICGYARTTLGLSRRMAERGGETPPDAPYGGMGKPAVIIGSSILCDAGFKWFQSIAHYLDVPCLSIDQICPGIDTDVDEVADYCIEYQTEELRTFTNSLEKLTGRKMDWDKLSHMVDNHFECWRIWWECHDLRKAIPCPAGSQDMFSILPGPYFLSYEDEVVEFCRKVYDEFKYRVDNKIGVIDNEKYRLIWAELPPWFGLDIFDYFAAHGGVFVTESWVYRPNVRYPIMPESVTDPLERLAWFYYRWWTSHYVRARDEAGSNFVQAYLDWARDFKCDGAVMHDIIGCRSNTLRHRHAQNVLMEKARIPTLIIESDQVDWRVWSDARIKRQIDSFMDTLDYYKRIRQQGE